MFDRFETELFYDYLIIGDPNAFENIDVENFEYLYDIFADYTLTERALILEGNQTTGVWATAPNLPYFDIYFHRIVLRNISVLHTTKIKAQIFVKVLIINY